MTHRLNLIAVTLVAAVSVAMIVFTALPIVLGPNASFLDFRAFFCATKVAAAGADPYLAAPLFACERSLSVGAGTSYHWALPAPVPGALLFLLTPLTILPYSGAVWLWFCATLAAVGALICIVLRLTNLPAAGVVAAFALSAGYASLDVGQIAPFAILAVTAAAWAVARERYTTAGVLASLALVEPHLGIPAAIALLVYVPRARLAVCATAGLLVIGSIARIGIAANLEYVLHVLPVHAQSEAFAWNQYSLTFLLTTLGIAPASAVAIASLSYVAMLSVGICFAEAVARAVRAPAAIVLFPVAAVTIGGTFIHCQQIAAALPFALLLYSRRRSIWTLAAVTALSLPPYLLDARPTIVGPLAVACAAALVVTLAPGQWRTQIGLTLAAVAFAVACPLLFAQRSVVHTIVDVGGTTLASEAWRNIQWATRTVPQSMLLLNVAPAWIALIVVIGSALRCAASPLLRRNAAPR